MSKVDVRGKSVAVQRAAMFGIVVLPAKSETAGQPGQLRAIYDRNINPDTVCRIIMRHTTEITARICEAVQHLSIHSKRLSSMP